MTYTITRSRRQIVISTSDHQRWFYQRTDAGAARANRKIAALEAVGYTEEQPAPDTFTQLRQMAQEGRTQ
jgi:hypothetical protein